MYLQSETCQISGLSEIYEKYFGDKIGMFIEVGAYDGYSFSNTWGLAKAGWKGIYFEPVPQFYEKCLETHKDNPNIVVENFAINKVDGKAMLRLGDTLTSGSEEQVQKVMGLDWAKGIYTDKIISVPCFRLDTYLDKLETVPEIDLLVIDVEGMEMNVLEGANLEKWKPSMIIIEAHEHHPDLVLRNGAYLINKYISIRDYEKIYSDEINNIYIRNELKNALDTNKSV